MAKKLHTSTAAPQAAPKHRRPRTSVPKSAPEASQNPVHTITNDDIATLAFSYWERRGCQGGNPQQDWARAEEELNSLLR